MSFRFQAFSPYIRMPPLRSENACCVFVLLYSLAVLLTAEGNRRLTAISATIKFIHDCQNVVSDERFKGINGAMDRVSDLNFFIFRKFGEDVID